MGERYTREDLEEFGLSAEPCPMCDEVVIVTKDDVIEHLLNCHSPVLLAVYVSLIMFLSDEREEDDINKLAHRIATEGSDDRRGTDGSE